MTLAEPALIYFLREINMMMMMMTLKQQKYRHCDKKLARHLFD